MDLTASFGIRLRSDEFPVAAAELAASLARRPTPELYVAAGLIDYMAADMTGAEAKLKAAFLAYKSDGSRRRAALAAAHLARLHFDGTGKQAVANGWLARAARLLESEGDCLERGWTALSVVGCSVAQADELDRNSALALAMARQFDDVDLECKALADSGLALVSSGRTDEGLARLDEAMAMATSGECENALITGQVYCSLVSACGRMGDLARLEAWLSVLAAAEPSWVGPAATPNLLLGHCRTEYGSLLCHAGRWNEAEASLRQAVQLCDTLHFSQRAQSRAALADLRLDQGRLAEAASLLNGFEQRAEAQLPLVRLHEARGDHDLAVAVARQALRTMSSDRLRCAPIYAVLVEAEIGRGNLEGAAEAADALDVAATEAASPQVAALAQWARGAVAAAEAVSRPDAARHFEAALGFLAADEWPLLTARIHLDLARALVDVDRAQAITEARRALAVFGRVGDHRMQLAQELLHDLGDAGASRPASSGSIGSLTCREREILELLANGLSNPQIAEALVISPKTAEHHVGAILRKLQLSSRSEAAVYAATLATRGGR